MGKKVCTAATASIKLPETTAPVSIIYHDQLIGDQRTYLISGRAITQDRPVPNRHGSWASEP